ncbi:hypothetical protein K25_23195 [Klebsiella pneumoniae]|nr:hypothetical protein K25_23195 [Klebsiella pneumoniae]
MQLSLNNAMPERTAPRLIHHLDGMLSIPDGEVSDKARRQLAVEYSTGRTRAIDEPLARDWLPLIGGPSGLTIFCFASL